MRNFAILLLLMLCLAACKPTEIFEGKPTMDQKLFLDTKAYTIDQANRVIKGGFKFIETTQVPGQRVDTAYLTGTQINWPFYIEKMYTANLYADSNNCYRYSMQQIPDLPNAKVTITYEPNYLNLKVNKLMLLLNANDSEVKTVNFEYSDNSFFKETTHKVTYIPGQVIQVYTKSKNLFGSKKEIIKSIYFLEGDMHAVDAIEILQ